MVGGSDRVVNAKLRLGSSMTIPKRLRSAEFPRGLASGQCAQFSGIQVLNQPPLPRSSTLSLLKDDGYLAAFATCRKSVGFINSVKRKLMRYQVLRMYTPAHNAFNQLFH